MCVLKNSSLTVFTVLSKCGRCFLTSGCFLLCDNSMWLMLGESQLLTIHHSRCYLSKRKLLPARKAGVQNWYHFLCAFQVLLKSHCDFHKCGILILDVFWTIPYIISLTPPILPHSCLSSKQSFINSCFTHLGRTVFTKSLSLWSIQSFLFYLFYKLGISWESISLYLVFVTNIFLKDS